MNDHIPDCAVFWSPSVLPRSESVSVLGKGLVNLEPPLCSSGYAPAIQNVDAESFSATLQTEN